METAFDCWSLDITGLVSAKRQMECPRDSRCLCLRCSGSRHRDSSDYSGNTDLPSHIIRLLSISEFKNSTNAATEDRLHTGFKLLCSYLLIVRWNFSCTVERFFSNQQDNIKYWFFRCFRIRLSYNLCRLSFR